MSKRTKKLFARLFFSPTLDSQIEIPYHLDQKFDCNSIRGEYFYHSSLVLMGGHYVNYRDLDLKTFKRHEDGTITIMGKVRNSDGSVVRRVVKDTDVTYLHCDEFHFFMAYLEKNLHLLLQ